jgi:HlyD family secretion protein
MSTSNRAGLPATLILVIASLAPAPPEPAQEKPAAGATTRRGDGIYSALDEPTTLLSIKPANTLVKKGDLVCELESFGLRTSLESHAETMKVVEAPLKHARLAREGAELAINEYLERTFKQQIQKFQHEIEMAESALKAAEGRQATAKRLYEKKFRPKAELDLADVNVQRARLNLEKIQRKKETLVKYTKEKTVKVLQIAVEKARAVELARQADVGRAQAVEEQLKKQIEGCKVLAPSTGRLAYPETIEAGAEVTKGQLLFRVLVLPENEPKETAK